MQFERGSRMTTNTTTAVGLQLALSGCHKDQERAELRLSQLLGKSATSQPDATYTNATICSSLPPTSTPSSKRVSIYSTASTSSLNSTRSTVPSSYTGSLFSTTSSHFLNSSNHSTACRSSAASSFCYNGR
jgi:hypothetical protein